MCYTGYRSMYSSSTQFFFTHLFLCYTPHYVRSGNKHITGILHHQDKIGQSRRIHSTTGTWAHNSTDLRYYPRCHRVTKKDFSVSCQRTNPFLNTGTPGIIEPDYRGTHLHGHIHHLADLFSIRLRKCPSEHCEVLSKNINQSFAYHTVTGNYPIPWYLLFLHTKVGTTMRHKFIKFDKRSFLQK